VNLANDEQIAAALKSLESLIEGRIRLEQLSDQMTKLANGVALSETIHSRLEQPDEFWVAFIEVDRFKSINDRFGYENANELLRKIAELLRDVSGCFPGTTSPFRAHGDEFYLLGIPGGEPTHQVDAISQLLGLVREKIAKLNVLIEGRGEMNCTVSIGWLMGSDIHDVRTALAIQGCLEQAVGEHANGLISYQADMNA
jgi:diguanylate cyclase (GGDEF)-like protein